MTKRRTIIPWEEILRDERIAWSDERAKELGMRRRGRGATVRHVRGRVIVTARWYAKPYDMNMISRLTLKE